MLNKRVKVESKSDQIEADEEEAEYTPADRPCTILSPTCQRYGVALRIDATTGESVVGKAGTPDPQPQASSPERCFASQRRRCAFLTISLTPLSSSTT